MKKISGKIKQRDAPSAEITVEKIHTPETPAETKPENVQNTKQKIAQKQEQATPRAFDISAPTIVSYKYYDSSIFIVTITAQSSTKTT